MAEQEVNGEGAYLTETSIAGLRDFCRVIEEKIDLRYGEAADKVSRMDLGCTTYSMAIM